MQRLLRIATSRWMYPIVIALAGAAVAMQSRMLLIVLYVLLAGLLGMILLSALRLFRNLWKNTTTDDNNKTEIE